MVLSYCGIFHPYFYVSEKEFALTFLFSTACDMILEIFPFNLLYYTGQSKNDLHSLGKHYHALIILCRKAFAIIKLSLKMCKEIVKVTINVMNVSSLVQK